MSKTATMYTASNAKNNFGELIDAAQRSPVSIERRGRSVAFIISPSDMERYEDAVLGARAVAVLKKGAFLGVKRSEAFLKTITHALR